MNKAGDTHFLEQMFRDIKKKEVKPELIREVLFMSEDEREIEELNKKKQAEDRKKQAALAIGSGDPDDEFDNPDFVPDAVDPDGDDDAKDADDFGKSFRGNQFIPTGDDEDHDEFI